jgi:hypothetical protein
MRWLLLLSLLLAGRLAAQQVTISPATRDKLQSGIKESLAAVPGKVAPTAPAVARAGRPIPRLSEATMRDESLRLLAPARKPALAATAATDPASPGTPGKIADGVPTAPGVFVLPKLEVTAERLTQLEARMRELDRRQASEEKAMEPTWVDTMLDLPVLSLLFGGHTAERRAAVAGARVEVMRWQRVLQAAREVAKTPEERAQIDADLKLLDETMRYWP